MSIIAIFPPVQVLKQGVPLDQHKYTPQAINTSTWESDICVGVEGPLDLDPVYQDGDQEEGAAHFLRGPRVLQAYNQFTAVNTSTLDEALFQYEPTKIPISETKALIY